MLQQIFIFFQKDAFKERVLPLKYNYRGMKKVLLLFLVALLGVNCFAKSFNGLSTSDVVDIRYVAKEEGYKDITLLIANKSSLYDSIPLVLNVIINNDTLTDYFQLKGALNKTLKTIYVYEGDSVKATLGVKSEQSIIIEKVKGNLRFVEPLVIQTSSKTNEQVMLGEYWDVLKPCIFRVTNFDSTAQLLKFTVNFNENYIFDDFYYQINVVSPDSSFYSVEGVAKVNEQPTITLSPSSQLLNQEVGVSKLGKYIIEIVPLMGIQRINGIKSVDYELVKVFE